MADDALWHEVEAYVDEVWEDVVADIRTLVKVRSVEDLSQASEGAPWGPGPRASLSRALAIAGRLGLATTDVDGYIGFGDLPGADERYLATIAHSDVVPEGLGWTVSPFDVTRRDGFLMGRGVLDDKGPLVLSLYAAHFFVRQVARTGERLPYTLRCLIGAEEETSMGDLAHYLAHYPAPLFAFTPDADFPLICGEKGVFEGRFTSGDILGTPDSRIVTMDGGTVSNAICGLATATVRADADTLPVAEGIDAEPAGGGLATLTAHGRGGHASLPEGTVNAIGMLASYLLGSDVCSAAERAFLELERLLCASGHDGAALGIASSNDRFGALTLVGGTIHTEGARLVQSCDARYPDATTHEAIAQALCQAAREHGATFEPIQVKEPFYTDPSSPEVTCLLTTYDELTGGRSEAFVIGGGTYARMFPRACAFGPYEPAEDVPAWVGPEHGPDEAVSEESLRRALEIYIVSIARLMRIEY